MSHEARAGEPGDWLPTLSGVWLAMGYTVVHAALLLLAQRRTDVPAYVWIVDCVILVAAVLFVARAGELRLAAKRSALVRVILLWAPVAYVLWCYRWSGWTLHAVFPPEFTVDGAFIALERWLGQPSLWLALGRSRATTETLHAFYASYYLYTPLVGVYLYARRRYADFEEMTCAVMIGYAVCYVMFAFVPLWGPRWSLVDAGLLAVSERRLEGYGVTRWINSLQWGSVALKGGAMPSSHASTGVVFMIWCWRLWGRNGGVLATVVVAGMAVGAVYGRYHFVTDVVAGGLLGYVGVLIAARWPRRRPGHGPPQGE